MALIRCKECENEVSDLAINCPKCGYKLRTPIINALRRSLQVFSIIFLIISIFAFYKRTEFAEFARPIILVISIIGGLIFGLIEKLLRIFAKPKKYEYFDF